MNLINRCSVVEKCSVHIYIFPLNMFIIADYGHILSTQMMVEISLSIHKKQYRF